MDGATINGTRAGLGFRVYGLGIMGLGLVGLVWGNFVSGQSVPKDFPGYTALAYVAAAFLVIAGAALEWKRTVAWAAAALCVYYAIVVFVMNGHLLPANYAQYGIYESVAIQLAVMLGALVVYASHANLDAALAARIIQISRMVFGICAIVFGGAHFVYMNLTAPLVPAWLPPSQIFWGYATGVFHIAAGLAILSGVRARLAAILLTIMYAAFTPLVHIPQLLAGHLDQFNWSENGENITLTGVAWVVADSLSRRKTV
ncbi:MAG TPA: hypothetical protein VHW02_14865 [Rhizomicrobium sp.]|jgi:uncharacterized membrane protein|nr:hypothetical protein [Rhizomicrobium sp.]